MVHQVSGKIDLADSLLGNNQKLNQKLDKINSLVDWKPFEQAMNRIYSSSTGRPSHPVLLLFKGLLLQAWYNLSDYALEEILDDRLSFRRFVGLSVSEQAPDHSVFSRFRDQLIQRGIHAQLFNELERQLEGRRLIVKRELLLMLQSLKPQPKNQIKKKTGLQVHHQWIPKLIGLKKAADINLAIKPMLVSIKAAN